MNKVKFSKQGTVFLNGKEIGEIVGYKGHYSVRIDGCDFGEWVFFARCKSVTRYIMEEKGVEYFKDLFC